MSASQEPGLADMPAYVSHTSFRNFVDGIGAAGPLPTQINKSVMPTLNHGTRTSLMSSLRALHLLGEGDRPTKLFETLVAEAASDEGRRKVMQEILRISYPYLFDGTINLERASSQELFDRFRTATKATGATVNKAVIFFLLAASEAGVSLSPHLAKGRPAAGPSPRRSKPKRAKARAAAADAIPPPQQNSDIHPGNGNGSDPMTQLLGKFPTFDPSWDQALKLKWFEGFDLLAKRVGAPKGGKKAPTQE